MREEGGDFVACRELSKSSANGAERAAQKPPARGERIENCRFFGTITKKTPLLLAGKQKNATFAAKFQHVTTPNKMGTSFHAYYFSYFYFSQQ